MKTVAQVLVSSLSRLRKMRTREAPLGQEVRERDRDPSEQDLKHPGWRGHEKKRSTQRAMGRAAEVLQVELQTELNEDKFEQPRTPTGLTWCLM